MNGWYYITRVLVNFTIGIAYEERKEKYQKPGAGGIN